ncbi:MAG: NnrU family protein, partial [Pseudomonadales bacterium]
MRQKHAARYVDLSRFAVKLFNLKEEGLWPMWIMVMGGTLFLATHLGVSSTSLRPMLTDKLGQRGYLGFYSLLAIATLGHLIWLYNIVPRYDY